jgi:hypothetical protein
MATKKKRPVIEWVGGLASMPNYVTGEGEPYRPEMLFWIGPEGTVLGSTLGKPGELLGLANNSLRETIANPGWGKPQSPERIRVASPELAQTLREGHPGLAVVLAPTPEADDFLEAMREKFGANGEHSYLSPGIDPDAVASFFRAAAALFRTKPWQIVPTGQSLASVTVSKPGLKGAALSVIGQIDESLGFILFASVDDFETFVSQAGALERGEKPTLPRHLSLYFERGAELSDALRKEIAEHHWEVASADAYPSLATVDADLIVRPLTAEDVTLAEAIARALPQVLSDEQRVRAAWNGGEPVMQTVTVTTHAGDIEVTLRIPHEDSPRVYAPEHDLLADLFELAQDGDELDRDACAPLEEELVRRFAASPEGKELPHLDACYFVMEFAASYFDATIATLEPEDLEEIVFEIIPKKVSIGASAARGLIEESRAFYAFLKREFGLKQADACLEVLGGDAVKELKAALSNPAGFGLAKSLVMGRLGAAPSSTPSRPVDKAAQRAKKNQRKAARKARKKNR